MRHIEFRFIVCCLMVLALGGCYYEVHDARTDRVFYSPKWVAADGYQGPLTFEDHTGTSRRVEHAIVYRIGKQDYLEATTPPPVEEPVPTELTPPPN